MTRLYGPGNILDLPNFKKVYCAAQNALGTGDTYEDVASLGSLEYGLWLVSGQVLISTTATLNQITAKIWDGTTSYAAAQAGCAASSTLLLVIPPTIINLLAAATIKLSAASSGTAATIEITPPNNATGLTGLGSFIQAQRVG